MIHYIILMEERAFQKNSWHTLHFYKKGEGNSIPSFKKSVESFESALGQLVDDGFKTSVEKFSIEEIILNDVAEITIFFFRQDGTFERTGIYRRVAS
jgi:DUF1365 family protein